MSQLETSRGGRLQEFASHTPPGTLCVGLLLGVTYCSQLLFGIPFSSVSLAAAPVIYARQVQRIITSTFVHGNLMHIGFNTVSLFALGVKLEGQVGTLLFFSLVLVSTILTGTIYVAICWVASLILGSSWMFVSAIGFSGVLFSFLVLDIEFEISTSGSRHRPIFGIPVTARLYPWTLLALLQVILPNVSFVGHLAGILTGYILSSKLSNTLLPSLGFIRRIESATWSQFLVQKASFKNAPSREVLIEQSTLTSAIAEGIRGVGRQFVERVGCSKSSTQKVMTVSGKVGSRSSVSEVESQHLLPEVTEKENLV